MHENELVYELYLNQRHRQDFGSGGGTFYGVGLVGGPGAEGGAGVEDPPGRQKIFENLQKNS